jgi:hypothetical protein
VIQGGEAHESASAGHGSDGFDDCTRRRFRLDASLDRSGVEDAGFGFEPAHYLGEGFRRPDLKVLNRHEMAGARKRFAALLRLHR